MDPSSGAAEDLLADLAKQESSVARARRLEAYVRPQLLCIDEVGHLSYDVRHADLLFEVVARRHEKKRAIVLTANKAFAEWHTTFPNASCVAALVDRLINRADIVASAGLTAPLARRPPIALRGCGHRVARRSLAGERVTRRVSGRRARS